MNITGVNYISNATDSTIQAGNNNQLQVVVPSNLSSKEAGIALLRSLQAGDSFTGEITNITQNEITLALSDSVSVNATLADALSYNIGDKASFSVKENKFLASILLLPYNNCLPFLLLLSKYETYIHTNHYQIQQMPQRRNSLLIFLFHI